MYCDLTLVKECGEFQIMPLLTTSTLWWWKRSDFKVINLMLLKVLEDTLELARTSFFWLANKGGKIFKLGICYFYQQTGLQVKQGKEVEIKNKIYRIPYKVFLLSVFYQ